MKGEERELKKVKKMRMRMRMNEDEWRGIMGIQLRRIEKGEGEERGEKREERREKGEWGTNWVGKRPSGQLLNGPHRERERDERREKGCAIWKGMGEELGMTATATIRTER